VGDALAAYYVANDLPADGGAADTVFHVRIGPFTVLLALVAAGWAVLRLVLH
jgi:hypothetical protein